MLRPAWSRVLIDLSAIPLHALLQAAPDPTVIVDDRGRIVFASARVEDVFGYAPAELAGQPVEILLPVRWRTVHRSHRASYARAPRARPMGQAMALLGRHRDGSEFPVEVSLSPLETAAGSLVTSTIRDISERRRIEATLDRERALLDSMISTAPTIVMLLDPEGRIEQVNPYLEKISGFHAPDLLGRDWFDTMLPDDEREGIRALFAETMLRGFNDGHVNPICTRAGERRQIRWQSQKLLGERGEILGLLCIGYDVTRQLEHEQELQAACDEADRANAGKSRFLAAASHDLRQPLQSLGLYLSVLTRLLEDDKPLEVCGKMRKSLDTMGELLDALLDISRLDSGSIVPELQDFAIDDVLDRILTDNVQQAEEKGLTLTCRSAHCVVHSDPGLLERVLENLVTNAIRYTEQGSVTISCESVDGRARIRVSDTGIGIPGDALERVFDEYYQLDNPVRDRSKGLGLGLSIVRHLARLLDLELEVASEVGQGTTFTVGVAIGQRLAESPLPPAAVPRVQGRAPLVLLVEDDEAVIDAARMVFESVGADVHGAGGGDGALELIAQGVRPDLLVCDYRLPGITGVEVVRRIQRTLSRPIPSLIMTGDTAATALETAGLANVTVLHKPIDAARLLALAEAALGLDERRQSGVATP